MYLLRCDRFQRWQQGKWVVIVLPMRTKYIRCYLLRKMTTWKMRCHRYTDDIPVNAFSSVLKDDITINMWSFWKMTTCKMSCHRSTDENPVSALSSVLKDETAINTFWSFFQLKKINTWITLFHLSQINIYWLGIFSFEKYQI